jgi:predicted DNA-binding transcriptional regulator YafY
MTAITFWDADNQGYRRVEPMTMHHDGTRWIMLARDTLTGKLINLNMDRMASVVGHPTLALALVP